jgi:DNA repair exonuclease SbcCD ATPase subunit
MNPAKYRINRITAEGFRAFTDPQSLDIDGRNAFIFGLNGQGKSSLIEAIRWALFGSPSGRDIEVRNTFYSKGPCTVSIQLSSQTDTLEITRELRPGTNSTRQTIRDSAGNVVRVKDVLPQLARIGHQEGTQVIFAAQHATGRQAQVDITDFTRVLCYYLHLEKVPELIESFDSLIEERTEEFHQLSQKVEAKQGELRTRLQEVETRLGELLKNPPWGAGASPTEADTEAKILALTGEAAVKKGTSNLEGEQSNTALDRLRLELENLAEKTVQSLKTQLLDLSARVQTAEKILGMLSQSREKRVTLTQQMEKSSKSISELLKEDTVESLKSYLTDLELKMTMRDAASDLAQRAKLLCSEYHWSECPVCGVAHPTSQSAAPLNVLIQAKIDGLALPISGAFPVEDIRFRLREIEVLRKSQETDKTELDVTSSREAEAEAQLLKVLNGISSPIDIPNAKEKAEELKVDVAALANRIDDTQGEKPHWIKRIKDLEQELIFHGHRREIQRLQTKLTEGMSASLEILHQYQELLATSREVENALSKTFDAALDRALPPLERLLTEVFQRLTQQLSFDQVRIFRSPDNPRHRELRVASSRSPNQAFQPNVLNGQASKALQLVPYFVFSRFQPDIMELDLLLIDDPSESFDTSHVTDLVKELAVASKHSQLFVATHEREKFETQLDASFEKLAMTKINVVGFAPMEGPKFSRV